MTRRIPSWRDFQREARLSTSLLRLAGTPKDRLRAAVMPFRVFLGLDKPVRIHLRKHDQSFDVWVKDRSHLIAIEEVLANEIYAEAAPENPRLIIDLGANIGVSVLYFKTRYPNATMVALEPDPDSFALLQKNTEALSDVTVRQAAAGATTGLVPFAQGRDSLGSSTIVHNPLSSTITVPSVQLDEIVVCRQVDLLKIDIEGAEFDVLRSSDLSNVQCVVGEIHLGDSTTRDVKALTDLLPGFSVRFLATKYAQEPWDELRDFVASRSESLSVARR